MNKKDVLKLIIISLIIMCCMLTILIVLGEKYIEDNSKVADVNSKQTNTNIEPTALHTDENMVIETTIPTVEPTQEVVEEIPVPTVEPTQEIIEETPESIVQPPEEEVEYPKDKYYIKVNNQMNTVTVYTQDENGECIKPIKAMICSTGEKTPQNSKYVLPSKRWEWRLLFGDVYGKYTTHISGHILFHSVPYLKKSSDTLKYEEYDKLGTAASAGCVRLKVEDAKWIYDKCLTGSIVEFYNSPDPGPLGKPTAMQISSYEKYRNWDPTDPHKNNPWNNIL